MDGQRSYTHPNPDAMPPTPSPFGKTKSLQPRKFVLDARGTAKLSSETNRSVQAIEQHLFAPPLARRAEPQDDADSQATAARHGRVSPPPPPPSRPVQGSARGGGRRPSTASSAESPLGGAHLGQWEDTQELLHVLQGILSRPDAQEIRICPTHWERKMSRGSAQRSSVDPPTARSLFDLNPERWDTRTHSRAARLQEEVMATSGRALAGRNARVARGVSPPRPGTSLGVAQSEHRPASPLCARRPSPPTSGSGPGGTRAGTGRHRTPPPSVVGNARAVNARAVVQSDSQTPTDVSHMHDAADFVAVTQRPKRPAFWSIVNEPTSLPASTLKGSKGPGQEQLVLPRGDHGVIRLVQAWRQLHGAETGSVGDAALDIASPDALPEVCVTAGDDKPSSRRDAMVLQTWIDTQLRSPRLQNHYADNPNETANVGASNRPRSANQRLPRVDIEKCVGEGRRGDGEVAAQSALPNVPGIEGQDSIVGSSEELDLVEPPLNIGMLQVLEDAMCEMVRQVAVHCWERGEVLASVWNRSNCEAARVLKQRRCREARMEQEILNLRAQVADRDAQIVRAQQQFAEFKRQSKQRVHALYNRINMLHSEITRADANIRKRASTVKWRVTELRMSLGIMIGQGSQSEDSSAVGRDAQLSLPTSGDLIQAAEYLDKMLREEAKLGLMYQMRANMKTTSSLSHQLQAAESLAAAMHQQMDALQHAVGMENMGNIDWSNPTEALKALDTRDAVSLLERLPSHNAAHMLTESSGADAVIYLSEMRASRRAGAILALEKADIAVMLDVSADALSFMLGEVSVEAQVHALSPLPDQTVRMCLVGMAAHVSAKAMAALGVERAVALLHGMTHEQGCAIMSMIPPDKAGALLVGTPHVTACGILKTMDILKCAAILSETDPYDAVRMNSLVSKEQQNATYNVMRPENLAQIFRCMPAVEVYHVLQEQRVEHRAATFDCMTTYDVQDILVGVIKHVGNPVKPAHLAGFAQMLQASPAPVTSAVFKTLDDQSQLKLLEIMVPEYSVAIIMSLNVERVSQIFQDLSDELIAANIAAITKKDVRLSFLSVLVAPMSAARLAALCNHLSSALSQEIISKIKLPSTRSKVLYLLKSLNPLKARSLRIKKKVLACGALKTASGESEQAPSADDPRPDPDGAMRRSSVGSVTSQASQASEEAQQIQSAPSLDVEELRRNWTQMEDAAFKWKFSPKHARLKEAMRMYPKAPARGADWFALFLNKLYQGKLKYDQEHPAPVRDRATLAEFMLMMLQQDIDDQRAQGKVGGQDKHGGKQKKILEVAAEIMSTLRDSANQVVVDPRFVTFEKLITEEWGPEILSKLLEAGNLCMQAGPYFPVLCIEYPVKYARGEDVTLCTAKCEAVASWVFGPRTAASKAAFKANLDRLGHPASHDDSNQILTFDSHPELLKAQGLQQSPTIDDFFCIEQGVFLHELCWELERCNQIFARTIPDLFKEYDEDKSGSIEVTEVEAMLHAVVRELVISIGNNYVHAGVNIRKLTFEMFTEAQRVEITEGQQIKGETDSIGIIGFTAGVWSCSPNVIQDFVLRFRTPPPVLRGDEQNGESRGQITSMIAQRHWKAFQPLISTYIESRSGNVEPLVRGIVSKMVAAQQGTVKLHLYVEIMKRVSDDAFEDFSQKIGQSGAGTADLEKDINDIEQRLVQLEDSIQAICTDNKVFRYDPNGNVKTSDELNLAAAGPLQRVVLNLGHARESVKILEMLRNQAASSLQKAWRSGIQVRRDQRAASMSQVVKSAKVKRALNKLRNVRKLMSRGEVNSSAQRARRTPSPKKK